MHVVACGVRLQQLLIDEHRVDRRPTAEVVLTEGLLRGQATPRRTVGFDAGPVVVVPCAGLVGSPPDTNHHRFPVRYLIHTYMRCVSYRGSQGTLA